MCGENAFQVGAHLEREGSSPRVRGKPVCERRASASRGLIPACAGKTFASTPVVTSHWAHPRVCGENLKLVAGRGRRTGSSPRVRGKPHVVEALVPPVGLIPACAGKTWCTGAGASSCRAHPRVCGENNLRIRSLPSVIGSSPRVRGKRGTTRRAVTWAGLIPACAGKTPTTPCSQRSPRAHPRVCGENLGKMFFQIAASGSSPRVRGKPGESISAIARIRLIPACAGKTSCFVARERWLGAHPRVCGENCRYNSHRLPTPGSSPRVRGKLTINALSAADGGLIPACAGKTGWPRPSRL